MTDLVRVKDLVRWESKLPLRFRTTALHVRLVDLRRVRQEQANLASKFTEQLVEHSLGALTRYVLENPPWEK